jgi:hypothetical protein
VAGEMKRLLADELARQPAPPIGNLIEESMRQGQRRRRLRRAIAAGAGMTGAAVATVMALLAPTVLGIGPQEPDGKVAAPSAPETAVVTLPVPPAEQVATPVPARSATTPTCGADPMPGTDPASPTPMSAVANCPAPEELTFPPSRPGSARTPGPLAPAMPEGVLELLIELLPGGTSDHAGSAVTWTYSGTIGVQLYLVRDEAPGMIRLWLSHEEPKSAPHCGAGELCYALPDGSLVILYDSPDDCANGRSVVLHRTDGVRIHLSLVRCLAWEIGGTKSVTPALTTQEALDIAIDPRWGAELPMEIVRRGAERFPNLTWVSGG